MIITRKHLDRRTFLRGAVGTAIALPLLDAMVPAATAQSLTAARQRYRFGAIYIPNGIYPAMWHPDGVGKDFAFKTIMQPLQAHRAYLTTVSGLKAPDGNKDMGGIHMGASSAFLNGTGPLGTNGDFNRIESRKSVDQHIADAIAEDTPLRSLELGTEDMGTSAGACDGYPCVFFNTMAWRDDQSPLPVAVNPQSTFERMFGDPGTPAQRLERIERKQSMLDSVLQETARLERMLGASDNAILDEYLTNIRRVEEQLGRMEARSLALQNTPDAPVGIPDNFDEHMTVTYDLLLLAFQGDISRVFSFMVGHEGSGRSYAHVGVKKPHHSTSHHDGSPEGLDQYARIPTYHMVKLNEFLDKLSTTRDGDGSLLDSSMIYFGSGMSNGAAHDRNNPPALIVGGANGRMEGNRHIAVQNKEPTSNLLLAMADRLGSEIESIGVSTGRIEI
jgi:hypothetical protein